MTSSLDDIAKALAGVTGGNDEESTVSHFLSTGFEPLDYALSSRYIDGGLPDGRIIEIFGPPSSGKTAIFNEVMKDAQRKGGLAGFNDHERSFDQRQGASTGLSLHPGQFIYKKPRTFEESIDLAIETAMLVRAKGLIPDTSPIAWGFDSLASMVPQSKLLVAKPKKGENDVRKITSYNMHDNYALGKATSAAFPAFAQMCEELNMTAVFLNQLKLKPGVTYGDPVTTPGGEAPKFFASIRIQLGAQKIKRGEGDDAVIVGQLVGCRVVKNKITRPFQKAKWRFMFNDDGTGSFDTVGSMIEFLDEQKLLEKAGNYIVWEGKKLYASQLSEKIKAEGSYQKLRDLLPANHEPTVSIPEEGDVEAEAA
jgi:recombination protein RecA